MCLAIYKPAGHTIPKEHLFAGYRGNFSHHCGSGFAWSEGGKLHVIKGIMGFDDFYTQYLKVEQAPMLVHFRLATHKPINKENCHPFLMRDGTFALIHNGMFSIEIKDPSLSDTGNFCKYIMEHAIRSGKHKDVEMMERVMGWNYVALMDANGEVIVYNGRDDQYDNGVWYSNSGYKYGSMLNMRGYE